MTYQCGVNNCGGGVCVHHGDCLEVMKDIPDGSVDLVITSPPYNLGKEYEKRSAIGEYLEWVDSVAEEIARVCRIGGAVCWQVGNHVNNGEILPLDILTYSMFQKRGFKLRNRIAWTFGHGLHCKNRFSHRYEVIMWMTKGDGYTFNLDGVRVPSKYPNKKHYKGPKKGQLSGNPLGKNPGDVWDIPNVKHNHPEKTNHPCQFPLEMINRLILSASNVNDLVLDIFMGSGTTGVACKNLKRRFIGIELDADYFKIACDRIDQHGTKDGP